MRELLNAGQRTSDESSVPVRRKKAVFARAPAKNRSRKSSRHALTEPTPGAGSSVLGLGLTCLGEGPRLNIAEGDGGDRGHGGGYPGGGCRDDDEAVRECDPCGVRQRFPELWVEVRGGVYCAAECAFGHGRRRGADGGGELAAERGTVDRGSEAAEERDAEGAAEFGGGF